MVFKDKIRLNYFINPFISVNSFISFLKNLNKNNLYSLFLEINNLEIDNNLISLHKKLFPWHFNDTIRSFTNPDISNLSRFQFSYNNRIHKHFGFSQLDIKSLLKNNIINIWDPKIDFNSKDTKPCLLVIKFIKDNDNLNLSVVWRKRDILKRLIPNIFCLSNLLKEYASKLSLNSGIIMDYSLQFDFDNNLKKKFISVAEDYLNK